MSRPGPGPAAATVSAAVAGCGGGLRSMSPTAVLAARGGGVFPGPARFIAFGAAVGELISDKQPDMGARTAARGLTMRIASSAVAGRELAGPPGALVAAAAAVGSAHLASRWRTHDSRMALAVVEDLASYALVVLATRGLPRR